MAIGVRDYLENLGHTVGYDKKTGDVLVKNADGKMTSIGSDGFTLNDDGRYYAESEGDILSALSKNGVSAKIGYSPVRNMLSSENAVGYNDKTGQIYINGRDYNVDGTNFIKIGDQIYGEDNFLKGIEKGKYENKYEDLQSATINKLLNESYQGYNPEKDENYQNAYKNYMKNAKADMGARGMISDSLAAYYASQGAAELMPAFAELDYEKYKDGRNDLKDALSYMGEFDKNSASAYKINSDAALSEAELLHKRESDAANLADKETQRQHDSALENQKHSNDMEYLEKEYGYKNFAAERDFGYEKEIIRLQNDLGISKAQAQAYYKMLYK